MLRSAGMRGEGLAGEGGEALPVRREAEARRGSEALWGVGGFKRWSVLMDLEKRASQLFVSLAASIGRFPQCRGWGGFRCEGTGPSLSGWLG